MIPTDYRDEQQFHISNGSVAIAEQVPGLADEHFQSVDKF